MGGSEGLMGDWQSESPIAAGREGGEEWRLTKVLVQRRRSARLKKGTLPKRVEVGGKKREYQSNMVQHPHVRRIRRKRGPKRTTTEE